MAGLAVELIVSWLLLWLVEKQNLSALGFFPTKSRIENIIVGFLASSLLCATYHLSTTIFAGNVWNLNHPYNARLFLEASWWTLRSVLFEELIFRGALLYIAIQKLGLNKACILSAVSFGVYHWFSYNVFGNPLPMLIIFVITGIAGLTFAFAFGYTRSIYLPIALHFGWNLVSDVVLSNGPLGEQMFTSENSNRIQGLWSVLATLFQLLAMPAVTFWYLKKRAIFYAR
jgi:membrane protease YdiL (CAAX protease family)